MSDAHDGWRTQCLGRYLIDLPSDALVSAKFKYGGGEVTTTRVSSRTRFRQEVYGRLAELSSSMHRFGGVMFVDRFDISPTSILLRSWASPNSRELHSNELFVGYPEKGVAFYRRGESGAQYADRALDLQKTIAGAIHYRDPGVVPTGPGFCIDSGLIARTTLNKEEFTAHISLREYPSVTITLMSYVTGKPDDELLRRGGRVPQGYEQVVSRMKSLRRGDRSIGPLKGQEILVRGDDQGKHSYQFLWEAQGRANSLEFPFISLELSTTDETDEDGEVIDAPFKSDDEAMKLWDSILETIRLRPGAV